jgi:L-alanine-DL-glutamate epimerase-like enolase superfamily enzyme
MKFRIGSEWSWNGVSVARFLGLVRELAQEVNGRMSLALDGNCRLTFEQALPIAKELDRLGFAWLEEPIPREEIDGYARLCEAVDMPITGGEVFTTAEQFRPYLEKRAFDIVQPDAGVCGITELMRITHLAARYGVHMIPHSWHNGLMAMANGHAVASLPPRPASPFDRMQNFLEVCMIQGPLQWGIFTEPPVIENSYLILPDKPGLGVELAPDLEATYPYIEGHYALVIDR